MRRLVLVSHRFDRLAELVEEDPATVRVEFVPTAADVLDNRAFVDEDVDRLVGMGFPVDLLSLTDTPPEVVAERLARARLVFVGGGNVFHLLHHAIASGFAAVVRELVNGGHLIYVGLSAGAVVAGPDLLPAASEATRWKAPHLASTTALGLVEFSVLPHYGQPERAARHQRVLAGASPHRLVPLTDEQAVVVRGARWEIVSAV